jgi:hypothetical protein
VATTTFERIAISRLNSTIPDLIHQGPKPDVCDWSKADAGQHQIDLR